MAGVTEPLEGRVQRRSEKGEEPAILVDGLWRTYGDRDVLRGVSLSLSRGESLVVVGPNGAGKTTLLRVLATLLRPGVGRVEVLDCSLPDDGWRLRGRIGFVGHDPLLYRELTARENLRFHARLHGLDRVAAEERIDDLLGGVGLRRRADEQVGRMSRGMVQRLSVCRAVLHEPELLLLDEPRAHLDLEGVAVVDPLIGAASGRTRVMVTHDVRGALVEGTRALALTRGGTVAFEGPAGDYSVADAAAIYGGEVP